MPPVLCGGIKRTRVCLQKGKGYLVPVRTSSGHMSEVGWLLC